MPPPSRKPAAPRRVRRPAAAPVPRLAPVAGPGRLIDEGLSFYEASLAGKAERYGRGETPHTIHVWWARRPHSAMRALVYAALRAPADKRAAARLSELGATPVPQPGLLAEAAAELAGQYGGAPRVLDMFGGGGTIAFEAALLGCDAHSIDVNELAVFLQQANLTYGATLDHGLLKQLAHRHGQAVLQRLARRTETLYPLRGRLASQAEKPIVYLWTYRHACPQCGYAYTLSRRPWLSKKAGKALAMVATPGPDGDGVDMVSLPDGEPPPSRWAGRGATACPRCSATATPGIADSADHCVAVVTSAGVGKQFALRDDALPAAGLLREQEETLLQRTGLALPATTLPAWSGIVNPALYGMRGHADLFNPRQRLVTLMLLEELLAEHRTLQAAHGADVARFVSASLSGLIDQMVDWNCRLSMWIPQNEQVGRAFCGPGVAMLWDYAEVDPVGTGPGNLHAKLERICAGIDALALLRRPVQVQRASAAALPYPDDSFDAIVTDPPYYDNIFYSVLADFFYVWKKPLIDAIENRPTTPPHVPTANSGHDELVASRQRAGGSARAAHDEYCARLGQALREAARVLKPDGLLAFVYSHASVLGWAALVTAFRAAPFTINSVQPLSIERKARPRALASEAVNTCTTFVARRAQAPRPVLARAALQAQFDAILRGGLHRSLLRAGWHEHDAGVALIAQGVALLANCAAVEDADTAALIVDLAGQVSALLPGFSIKQRASL